MDEAGPLASLNFAMRRGVISVVGWVLAIAVCAATPLRAELLRACTDCVDSNLLALVPVQLQYHRALVADDGNGFMLLREASERLVERPPVNGPAEDGAACYRPADRDWVEANGPTLALVDAAVRAPAFQLPLFDLDSRWSPYRQVVKLKAARADVRMSAADWSGASRDLLELFALGQRVLDGDPVLLTYLFGSAYQRDALSGMRAMATHGDAPDAVFAEQIHALEEAPGLCDGYARALRVELATFLLPGLLHAPQRDAGLLEAILDRSCRPSQRCRRALARLVRANPRAFDAEDTVRVASLIVDALTRGCGRAAERRAIERSDDWAERITGPLPEPLSAVLQPLLSGGRLTASDAEVERAASQVAGLTNPFGRYSLRDMHLSYFPTSRQAERAATLTLLAARRYEDRTGRLPADLDTLVGAGLLRAVPVDPFADAPLRYDPSRRLVWSVGADGIAGGGAASRPPADSSDDDLVWEIPRGG